MTAPASTASQLAHGVDVDLVHGVDVDVVAQAVRGCRGVEDLYGGFPNEVATYLPGRRVLGVRVGDHAVQIQVRAAWGMPIPQIAAGIQAAVVPLVGGRAVNVMIADLGDRPRASESGTKLTGREPDSTTQNAP